MYHSITIGTNLLNQSSSVPKISRNTWDDWHLIPATRPLVNPPTPNINRIAIPGGDGSLDLSEVIAGRTTFGDRQGSWSFYVENDFKPWSAMYSEIMKYLHGKELQCVLEDDPQYYYEGRFSVNEWRSDPSRSLIVINYILGPYKQFFTGGENWIWDTFSFGDPDVPSDLGDRIKSYRNMKVPANGSKTVVIEGSYSGASINVYTNRNKTTLTYDGVTYDLKKSIFNSLESVRLEDGTNRIVLRYNPTSIIDQNTDPKTANPEAYHYYTQIKAGIISMDAVPGRARAAVLELLTNGGYFLKPEYENATVSIYISGGML